ncbi:MAG: PD40 domain-containing protein [Candidatus Latescibacteria bacterium]|nr:PD40 domain-containing protein [Candidatus Latescibacterota bacterium]
MLVALVCAWGGGCYRTEHSNPLDGHSSLLFADEEGPSLIQPDGAEQWYAGTTQQIIWGTGHRSADTTVSLRLSIDDGQTYPYEIASRVPNRGTYAWPVPDLPSKQCRVQVVGATTRGASHASFSILRKPVPRQMTTGGGEWPSWRGDRLAFMSDRTGNSDVWVLNIESNQLVQVTTDPHFDGYPAWDKKGLHLAFTSARTGRNEVWASSLFFDARATQTQIQLTTTGGEQSSWQPLPASKKLAYLSPLFGQFDLATLEFSLPLSSSSVITAPRLLTDDGGKIKPVWVIRTSDNTNIIYFQTVRQMFGSTEIQTIQADAAFALPNSLSLPFTSPVRHPAVSPSGTRLAVSVDGDIWIVPLAEGRVTGAPLQVTFDPAAEDVPDWSTDRDLAFQSRQTGQWEIWTIRVP